MYLVTYWAILPWLIFLTCVWPCFHAFLTSLLGTGPCTMTCQWIRPPFPPNSATATYLKMCFFRSRRYQARRSLYAIFSICLFLHVRSNFPRGRNENRYTRLSRHTSSSARIRRFQSHCFLSWGWGINSLLEVTTTYTVARQSLIAELGRPLAPQTAR